MNSGEGTAVPPTALSTKPVRMWAPSAQSIQYIAAAADVLDKRAHDGGADLVDESTVFMVVVFTSRV